MKTRRVLFLSTGNSCRSHMGEGLLRNLAGRRYEALSAGAKPAGYVHPVAQAVMEEFGIHLSDHPSKDVREFLPPDGDPPDVIVSVCDRASRDCPAFPGVRSVQWPLEDPAKIEDEKAQIVCARKVRDELKSRLEAALESNEFD